MSCDCSYADLSCHPAVAGDPYVVTFEFTDDADAAIDLTGYTVDLVAKMDPEAVVYDVEIDESAGIVVDGPAGTAAATIPTTGLSGNVHFRVTIASGSYSDSLQGMFKVTAKL